MFAAQRDLVSKRAVFIASFEQQLGEFLIGVHGEYLEHRNIRAQRFAAPHLFHETAIQRGQIVQIHFQLRITIDKAGVVEQMLRARQRVQLLKGLQRTTRAADGQALERQQTLGDGPAFVQLADEIVFVRAHVIEKYLAEFFVPRDVADGAQRDARCFHVHQQEADTALLLHIFVGAHQHVDVGGVVRH